MTGPDGRLLSYSFPRALGAYILRALDRAERESLNLGYAINEVRTYVRDCVLPHINLQYNGSFSSFVIMKIFSSSSDIAISFIWTQFMFIF